MGRRKKEPAEAHRARIALAAARLIREKGVAAATVDEIADAAGYSKATLYVYFQSKEDVVGFLTLEGMRMLRDRLCAALEAHAETRKQYDALCAALVQFQADAPLYFDLALREINVDLEQPDTLPVEREIYAVGEALNEALAAFLQAGIDAGALRPELPLIPTVFAFWGMLAGLARTAAHKERYLQRAMGLSRDDFLRLGFDTLYRSISRGGLDG